LPPTTLDALSDMDESTTAAVTVSMGDWLVLPLSDAVMVAVPTDTAVTAIAALVEPACTVTGVCTVTIAGLLLDSDTIDPPLGAGAVSVTVPCPLPPTPTLVAPSVTLDTAGPPVGPVGEPEPPH
jgi:hypothetical protein